VTTPADKRLHVIVGAGPVGSITASMLADAGERVRMITRTGRGPEHRLIERVNAEASDPHALQHAAAGATVLYSAGSPPYDRWVADWPPLAASMLAAAEKSGAVLVLISNLYAYGPVDHPMVETDQLNATGAKGRVRAQIWEAALAAHQQGRVRATELRSSDYYGPHVVLSQMGERVIPTVLAGKPVRVVGACDVAHTWSFINDVARALVTIGSDDRAWGKPWHAPSNPPLTQRQMIEALGAAAGMHAVKVRSIPPLVLRGLGLVVPMIREVRETEYQFNRPFVMDSTATQETFGLTPTSLDTSLLETVAWYRTLGTEGDQPATSASRVA
jgi:nucleoside-diphosphate-sugar epimerase